MSTLARIRSICAAALLGLALALPARAETLSIPPVMQETPVWCWLAVAEMVLDHYDVPAINPVSYQCGLASLIAPPCWANCGNCVISGGPVSTLLNVLRQYPPFARFRGAVDGRLSFSAISKTQIKENIDRSRPIIAGISPSGFAAPNLSQHVALIIGYEESGDNLDLIVNDPFPFALPMFSGAPNPYLRAGGSELQNGRYRIRFESFRDSLRWRNTISRIRCTGPDCAHSD